jgi:hypothetical protein
MLSKKATRMSLHSRADGFPRACDTKNSRSAEIMMLAASMLTGGMEGGL